MVENERKVVYSERRLRVEDSNAALLDEQVQATAFLAHPYRIPTIGWPSDIQSWTMADLQGFYPHLLRAEQLHPDPGRGCRARTGLRAGAEAFRSRTGGPLAAAGPPREPEQQGERRLLLERPGQNPLVQYRLSRDRALPTRASRR